MNHETSEAAAVLDEPDELVHSAKMVPLTDQIRLDRSEIYVLLDRLRTALGLADEA